MQNKVSPFLGVLLIAVAVAVGLPPVQLYAAAAAPYHRRPEPPCGEGGPGCGGAGKGCSGPAAAAHGRDSPHPTPRGAGARPLHRPHSPRPRPGLQCVVVWAAAAVGLLECGQRRGPRAPDRLHEGKRGEREKRTGKEKEEKGERGASSCSPFSSWRTSSPSSRQHQMAWAIPCPAASSTSSRTSSDSSLPLA